MALEHRLAAEPYARHRAEGQAERVPVAKPDDLGGQRRAARRVDHHATANPEFTHRANHFDEQTLHGLDAAENLDFVDGIDGGDEGLHGRFCSESGTLRR